MLTLFWGHRAKLSDRETRNIEDTVKMHVCFGSCEKVDNFFVPQFSLQLFVLCNIFAAAEF